MPTSPQLSAPLVEENPVPVYADAAAPAVEDPETDPGAFDGELPSDLEEFAAPPRDEP